MHYQSPKETTKASDLTYENIKALLPPYPSASLFGFVRTPAPPKIPAEATDPDAVWCLIKAYKQAMEKRTGTKCWDFHSGDFTQSKFYQGLLSAAHSLRKFGFAPRAWASFCVWRWDNNVVPSTKPKGKKGKRDGVPITFMFSAKDIESGRRGYFEKNMKSFMGGQVRFPKLADRILYGYTGVQSALRFDTSLQTLDDVRRMVERYFPGGWERHYDRLKKAVQLDKDRMARLYERGVDLW